MQYLNKIIANDGTRAYIGSAVRSGTLPHALLISGPRGSGRHTVAKETAKALMCEGTDGSLPCGACRVCSLIERRMHPDIFYLTQQSGKATIGVEETRLMREDMFLSPNEASSKVYIIEDADALTPQAQNSLLKVLEEPPRNVYIFLINLSLDKILTTIKSRAMLIRTELIGTDIIERELLRAEGATHSREDISNAAYSANGALGVAYENLDPKKIKEAAAERDTVLAFLAALSSRAGFSGLYRAVNSLPARREELKGVLEKIIIALRDLIALQDDEQVPLLFFRDSDEAVQSAPTMSQKRIVDIVSIILGTIAAADKNVVISNLLTDMCVRIKQL